ncbi:MAG: hypothetical protein KGO81_05380 [Bacteroidota bacterium]|nr:hypothetical protein [Bacteroidota bacterium]
MNTRSCLLFVLLLIVFASCQKEFSIDTTNLGTSSGNGNAVLVSKIVMMVGSDTSTVGEFRYDSVNRPVYIKNTSIDTFGQKTIQEYIITRNSAGNITQFTTQVTDPAVGVVVTNTTVHYPSGSSNFDYRLTKSVNAGVTIIDSVVYTYNGNKVATLTDYYGDGVSPYSQLASATYNYDGNGNITTVSMNYPTSVLNNGVLSDLVYSYQYDSKNNPTNFGNDLMLLFGDEVAKNNFVSLQIKAPNPTPSSFGLNESITYTYLSNGYPATATMKSVSVNPDDTTVGNITYYYQ